MYDLIVEGGFESRTIAAEGGGFLHIGSLGLCSIMFNPSEASGMTNSSYG